LAQAAQVKLWTTRVLLELVQVATTLFSQQSQVQLAAAVQVDQMVRDLQAVQVAVTHLIELLPLVQVQQIKVLRAEPVVETFQIIQQAVVVEQDKLPV
jgi:hypothetical protein